VTAAEKYVAAAYLVVFVLVLLYVLIIAAKLQRLEQALQALSAQAGDEPDPARHATVSGRASRSAVEVQLR
jgi:CcmD family protein